MARYQGTSFCDFCGLGQDQAPLVVVFVNSSIDAAICKLCCRNAAAVFAKSTRKNGVAFVSAGCVQQEPA